MQKFHPLYDRVLVKRLDAESKTASGLIIPDTAQEKPIEGVVMAVGDGYYCEETKSYRPLRVKKEDRVLFGKYAGTEVRIDSVPYLIMKESDILGIMS